MRRQANATWNIGFCAFLIATSVFNVYRCQKFLLNGWHIHVAIDLCRHPTVEFEFISKNVGVLCGVISYSWCTLLNVSVYRMWLNPSGRIRIGLSNVLNWFDFKDIFLDLLTFCFKIKVVMFKSKFVLSLFLRRRYFRRSWCYDHDFRMHLREVALLMSLFLTYQRLVYTLAQLQVKFIDPMQSFILRYFHSFSHFRTICPFIISAYSVCCSSCN